jgi:hypothetical protein
LPGAKAIGAVRRLNDSINRANDWAQRETIVRAVTRYAQRLDIDVLLICPQNLWVDLPAAPELLKRTGLPSVAWFMDDYFADESSRSLVSEVWSNAHRRFVASESMQEHYSSLYGGECEMLNNAVTFPKRYTEPASRQNSRLRVVYAGSIHSYYMGAMSAALRELEGLERQIEFDIYSSDELPTEWRSKTGVPWRHLRPIPAGELIERLQHYDVLLLLSSFEPRHRALAETSQAGKMADYLAAGRCILAFGPEYADNVRYLKRHGIGETVTSQAPGALREVVLSLARHPDRRRELGERAYYFGREHRDKAIYSARLWRALAEASELPPTQLSYRFMDRVRGRLSQFLLAALYPMGRLKWFIRRIVKG